MAEIAVEFDRHRSIIEQGKDRLTLKEYEQYLDLQFAVITGCLRISKESIFTSLNHLKIVSILNRQYGEHFGFTEEEVLQLMRYYDVESRFQTMKEWYDGYTFGETQVYNPWSVINFMSDLYADSGAFPHPYWINTSSNDIIKDMISQADRETKGQIETLLSGGPWTFRCMKRSLMETCTAGVKICGIFSILPGI